MPDYFRYKSFSKRNKSWSFLPFREEIGSENEDEANTYQSSCSDAHT